MIPPSRRLFASLLPLLLIVGVADLHAGGGAWVRSAGGYYFTIGFLSITAEKEYGFDGEERPLYTDTARFRNGRIGITNLPLYVEYGVTDRVTVVLATQYTVVVREADIVAPGMEGLTESASASGLGDIRLSGRVGLLPASWPLVGSATLGVSIPTGSPNKEIPLGTGAADIEGEMALGHSFGIDSARRGYLQASGGYRLRERAADEYLWHVEAGVDILPTLGLRAVVDGVASTARFDTLAADNTIFSDEFVGSQSYARVAVALTYAFSAGTELSFSLGKTLDGRNTLDAGTLGVGVAWRR